MPRDGTSHTTQQPKKCLTDIRWDILPGLLLFLEAKDGEKQHGILMASSHVADGLCRGPCTAWVWNPRACFRTALSLWDTAPILPAEPSGERLQEPVEAGETGSSLCLHLYLNTEAQSRSGFCKEAFYPCCHTFFYSCWKEFLYYLKDSFTWRHFSFCFFYSINRKIWAK